LSSRTADRLFGSGLSELESFARSLDLADPLAGFRDRFEIPRGPAGESLVYLVGNSLGPLPTAARANVGSQLDRWGRSGVDGWFEQPDPWYGLDERWLDPLSRLVGGGRHEVAVMNGLTVNLHLLLASFFRPQQRRRKILIESPCFPSDRFAVETQLRWHGLDPDECLIEIGPPAGSTLIDEQRFELALSEHGDEIAVFLLGGVNFLTGQRFDLERLARATHEAGAVFGADLAHAVANVPLRLHDWKVDFAVWCHYKYVNGGPGAPGGAFIHDSHMAAGSLPRLGGWWGNDPNTRFRMQLEPDFVPRSDAAGWQLSCPSVLAMAPLGAALELIDEAGADRMREKSIRLTAYLEWLLTRPPEGPWKLLTPVDPDCRGAQLSLRVQGDPERFQKRLQEAGVIGDFREPDVLRLAPAPLFNSYHDTWRAAEGVRNA
jgi:kynureninase